MKQILSLPFLISFLMLGTANAQQNLNLKSKSMHDSEIKNDSQSASMNINPLCNQIVSGLVLNSNGDSLSGVSITVLGTSTGVLTNNQGIFLMVIPTGKHKLRFSSIGCISADINLEAQQCSSYSGSIVLVCEDINSGQASIDSVIENQNGKWKLTTEEAAQKRFSNGRIVLPLPFLKNKEMKKNVSKKKENNDFKNEF